MGRKNLPDPKRRLNVSPLSPFATAAAKRTLKDRDDPVLVPQYGVEPARTTPTERAMQEVGKTILRMEMKRAGVSYAGLAELLVKLGLPENEPNARNRIARGTFSMSYFIACLRALGSKTINVDIEVPKAETILAGTDSKPKE